MKNNVTLIPYFFIIYEQLKGGFNNIIVKIFFHLIINDKQKFEAFSIGNTIF